MKVNQRLNTKEETTMLRFNHKIRRDDLYRYALVGMVAIAFAAVLLIWPVFAQEVRQKVYGSPEDALKALADAVQSEDPKVMMDVLGPEGEKIISSGDQVEDKNARERFVKSYQEKIDIVKEKGDRATAILGQDDWPFPIPMVRKGEGWIFDTKAGKEEMLNRRVGRNELSAIRVCLGYVEAQREYAGTDRERDGIIQYAQKFSSDPPRRNGLYWEAAEGETPSPVGPFAARAAAEGYRRAGGKPTPYHGYYYKILKGQGKGAPGGSYSYLINGHMVAGFALVAWPAEYGVSGVMTFVVNQNGTVYEKDLGPKAEGMAKAMKLYDPDRTWRRAH
jgi:hypothetical protein